MKCRHCAADVVLPMLDLGSAPPSNAYLAAEGLDAPERCFPLQVWVCGQCWLAQTKDYARADELFDADYAYFSGTSQGWIAHAARYAVAISRRLALGRDSLVIEVASNDGYLLKNFVAAGIPCLGIEPTAATAAVAERQGIPVLREFFGEALGRRLAREGRSADLIVGNNVYAHVPDINDFTRGLKALLKPRGTITLEFPHLLQLLARTQFDTVYHEHFSYLSLFAVRRIFVAAGLRVCDVEELPTHGGSLRVYGCHADDGRGDTPAVARVLADEAQAGLQSEAVYLAFQAKADGLKNDLLEFLLTARREGRSVAAYGAAAKGNTLLNYAGVRPDLLPFVCDAAPAKQGKFMPGSRIPIRSPEALRQHRPDYLLILPWNIREEVMQQNADLAALGTRFVVAVPKLEIR